MLTTYIDTASRYDHKVVSRVVDRFISGEFQRPNSTFAPSLEEIMGRVRAEPKRPGDMGYVSVSEHRRAIYETQQKQLAAPEDMPKTQEQKDRVGELLKGFRQSVETVRAEQRRTPPEAPLTDEDREYARKLLEVPDGKKPLTAEQKAYRETVKRKAQA